MRNILKVELVVFVIAFFLMAGSAVYAKVDKKNRCAEAAVFDTSKRVLHEVPHGHIEAKVAAHLEAKRNFSSKKAEKVARNVVKRKSAPKNHVEAALIARSVNPKTSKKLYEECNKK